MAKQFVKVAICGQVENVCAVVQQLAGERVKHFQLNSWAFGSDWPTCAMRGTAEV